jgi:hypothetical protein
VAGLENKSVLLFASKRRVYSEADREVFRIALFHGEWNYRESYIKDLTPLSSVFYRPVDRGRLMGDPIELGRKLMIRYEYYLRNRN